ncbi:hypothetical protein [Pseudomonas putida]|uniref:Uncharacterized protein n=1 Tax=Pseudomonas putida TaxID=303 RepID=A0A2S3WBR3_PSEPU|nr:hypothetical protein [Pseudomonas putida]POF88369.1 hypothetical protein BGP80_10505 [Pseudomonas putida]
MKALEKILDFLWPDNRSVWEKKQERLFIVAVNKLQNYYVTDRGGLSMDPEEARKAVLRFAQQQDALPDADSGTTPKGLLSERHAWMRLDQESAMRYTLLVSENGLFSVVGAERFSTTTSFDESQAGRPALESIGKAVTSMELKWDASLKSAVQAHEYERKGVM